MSHLFDSLQSAAALVVIQPGFAIGEINLARWAQTYRCSPDEVREALNIAQNGSRKLPEEVAVQVSVPTIDDGGEK